MKESKTHCKKCGKEIDENQKFCDSCGFDNSKVEKKEKNIESKTSTTEQVKKGKNRVILLIFFALAVLFFFISDGFLVKALTLFQAALFIVAWLMGKEILKEPFKGLRTIITIIAFVMIIPIILTGGDTTSEYKKINWDYIVLKDHLPMPDETKGDINSNSDDYLSIDFKAKNEDKFRSYIEKCKKYGYTLDAETNTDSYKAKKDGYEIYVDFNEYSKEYSITLSKEEQQQTTNNTTSEKTTTESNKKAQSSTNSSGLRNDFKKAMDSYEKFIDEYISFMKKYQANPTDASLIKDYATYMEKYADFVKDFEKWEDNDLNTEETAYYLKVQARVTKKLADASIN